MNPLDATLFPPAPCMPCCGALCVFTAPTDLFGFPQFTDLADATAYISNLTDGCIASIVPENEDYNSITASFATNTYTLHGFSSSVTPGANSVTIIVPVNLVAGSLLSADFICSSTGTAGSDPSHFDIQTFASDGTPIGILIDLADASPSGFSGTQSFPEQETGFPPVVSPLPIPTDGCYFLVFTFLSGYGVDTSTVDLQVTVTCTDVMVPGGIRAAYDDGSGGTDYLVCT